jgi:hypothetical protein
LQGPEVLLTLSQAADLAVSHRNHLCIIKRV